MTTQVWTAANSTQLNDILDSIAPFSANSQNGNSSYNSPSYRHEIILTSLGNYTLNNTHIFKTDVTFRGQPESSTGGLPNIVISSSCRIVYETTENGYQEYGIFKFQSTTHRLHISFENLQITVESNADISHEMIMVDIFSAASVTFNNVKLQSQHPYVSNLVIRKSKNIEIKNSYFYCDNVDLTKVPGTDNKEIGGCIWLREGAQNVNIHDCIFRKHGADEMIAIYTEKSKASYTFSNILISNNHMEYGNLRTLTTSEINSRQIHSSIICGKDQNGNNQIDDNEREISEAKKHIPNTNLIGVFADTGNAYTHNFSNICFIDNIIDIYDCVTLLFDFRFNSPDSVKGIKVLGNTIFYHYYKDPFNSGTADISAVTTTSSSGGSSGIHEPIIVDGNSFSYNNIYICDMGHRCVKTQKTYVIFSNNIVTAASTTAQSTVGNGTYKTYGYIYIMSENSTTLEIINNTCKNLQSLGGTVKKPEGTYHSNLSLTISGNKFDCNSCSYTPSIGTQSKLIFTNNLCLQRCSPLVFDGTCTSAAYVIVNNNTFNANNQSTTNYEMMSNSGSNCTTCTSVANNVFIGYASTIINSIWGGTKTIKGGNILGPFFSVFAQTHSKKQYQDY